MTSTEQKPGTSLVELIAKVEAATGPDRYVDALLQLMVDPDLGSDAWRQPHIGWWVSTEGREEDRHALLYTGSVCDAALALMERVLPEWRPSTQRSRAGVHDCYLHFDDETGWLRQSHGQAWTLPLAIIIATLRALSSSEHI